MMPDDSLDIAVAQAVEPIKDFYDLGSSVSKVERRQCAGEVSPMQMWLWYYDEDRWIPVDVSDSIDKSMRAYMLFWERTGWRLIELKHVASEDWLAILKGSMGKGLLSNVMCSGKGRTAAIAICEAIKAASLADESLKGDSLQGEGSEVRSSATESA